MPWCGESNFSLRPRTRIPGRSDRGVQLLTAGRGATEARPLPAGLSGFPGWAGHFLPTPMPTELSRDQMFRGIAVVALVIISTTTAAAATQVKSAVGVELHGPQDSWELCRSRRCLRLLRSSLPPRVRRTAMPAKRQHDHHRHRSAYHRRHHDGGPMNGYAYCGTVYIPYGWTWLRANSCQ